MDRRALLQTGAAALTAGFADPVFAQPPAAPSKLKINLYSRQLQWLRTPDDVAKALLDMGYDGTDITVRPAPGHVDPTKVKTDLPPFVNAIRAHGLSVDTITAPIVDANSPNAEAILDTASSLGIKHYVWGGYRYDASQPIFQQIEAFKPRCAALVKLNEKYGMKAMYHNFSGFGQAGAMIFDLLEVLRNFDSRWVGFHYDTGHATEGGGNGTWALGLRALGPYLGGMSFKDAVLSDAPNLGGGGGRRGAVPAANEPAQTPAASAAPSAAVAGARGGRRGGGSTNPWHAVSVPLGTGMVDLAQIAQILKENNFQGTVEVQAEYSALGGANNGSDTITLPREQVLAGMRADLVALKGALGSAGLI